MLTLLGWALRVWKADWSLPFVPHPDEPAIMNTVLRMLRDGDANPHFFYYPSLWIYVQALVGWLHLQWGLAHGLYGSVAALPPTTDIATTVPGFFVWGRVAAALAGAATLPAVYALGDRLHGRAAGLLAALLLAFNPLHVQHAHVIMPDVPSALLVALALLPTLRIAERGAWRDYALAGLLGGLAAGVKHHAAIVALPIVVAHGLHWRSRLVARLPRLLLAALVMIGAFLATSPFIVLAFDEFRRDLSHQLGDYAAGAHGDTTGAWPLAFYLRFYREQGIGLLGGALAFGGAFVLFRRRDPRLAVLLTLVGSYLLIFLPQGNHFMRNLIPTQIALVVLAGVGAAALLQRLCTSQRGLAVALVPLGLVLLLAAPTRETARYLLRLTRGDTRVHALRWIETHVPPGVQIVAELKPVPQGVGRWTELMGLPQRELAWYRRQGYAYLLVSSDVWRQYRMPEAYRRWLGERRPQAVFGGADSAQPGPRLEIYATDLSPADVPDPLAAEVRFGGARLLGVAVGRPDAAMPTVGLTPGRDLRAGEVLALRSFWQIEQPLERDYFIFVHLLNDRGERLAQRDAPPWQGMAPTSRWQPGTIVVDVNDLVLPPTLAPGVYRLRIGMFDPDSGTAPPLLVDGRLQPEQAVDLGSITVVP